MRLVWATTDNGSEFADHLTISKKLKVKVFFADPYSSWQKGAIENANKLIRQYIPKEMELNSISDKKLAFIIAKINERHREKLDFDSPKKLISQSFPISAKQCEMSAEVLVGLVGCHDVPVVRAWHGFAFVGAVPRNVFVDILFQ